MKKKKIRNSEKKSKILRRSIYANTNINAGSKLTSINITTKRPFIGIGSENFFKILNKKLKKNKKKFDPIYFKDINFN